MEKENDQLTEKIIGAAIAVHRALGPGLLESAYEACLVHELGRRGMMVRGQVDVPVVYGAVKLDCGYRLDLLVEESVVIEVKAVDELAPVHMAQLLTYLKLSGKRVGLLINFNVETLKPRFPRWRRWRSVTSGRIGPSGRGLRHMPSLDMVASNG